jgi:hypothetical protein
MLFPMAIIKFAIIKFVVGINSQRPVPM